MYALLRRFLVWRLKKRNFKSNDALKRLLPLLLSLLPLCAAQSQRPLTPTVISVGDILPNYGLDTLMVNDTSYIVDYLESQPQDYVALTNYCVSVRTKANQAISSIENDYRHSDSLIWIDSNTVLSDYSIYEYRLRRLADFMGRMSIRYSRLEQQRVEAEKEAARQRAIEEAARQQRERDKEAADLRDNIDLHHRAIIKACDGVGIRDKNRLKELKDLYYSYLMVYNKYDLSTGHATQESIVQLDELNAFQNDLLENVIGPNSLPSQIENFKNQLKVRCEKDNSDVYRSYSRVFKQSPLPQVTFADVREYGDYINRLQTVSNIQNRYLQTLDLRATINSNSDQILQLYGKKYREAANSYKEVMRSINLVPSFTTNAESLNFIRSLEEFIAAQQRYLDDYTVFEDITAYSDTILNGRASRFRDVASAYRKVQPTLVPWPKYRTVDEADLYDEQLGQVIKVQQCYLSAIATRTEIERLDDTLMDGRKIDRTLYNGYRLLRKQADLEPNFSTVERGTAFLATLSSHVEMQRLCAETFRKRQTIVDNADRIAGKRAPYGNIAKAYKRLAKVYDDFGDITNTEDLRRYARQTDAYIAMQEAFLRLIASDYAASSDSQLKKETDVERIKTVIGLK